MILLAHTMFSMIKKKGTGPRRKNFHTPIFNTPSPWFFSFPDIFHIQIIDRMGPSDNNWCTFLSLPRYYPLDAFLIAWSYHEGSWSHLNHKFALIQVIVTFVPCIQTRYLKIYFISYEVGLTMEDSQSHSPLCKKKSQAPCRPGMGIDTANRVISSRKVPRYSIQCPCVHKMLRMGEVHRQ